MAVDRKKLILEAAAKSFSMFGYKATTMDQVAKIANVGKGTIYTFFKNKEQLFDEIITGLIMEMKLEADASFDPNSTFMENVHRTIMRMLEYRKEHQLTIKLFQEQKEMGTLEVKEVINRLENAILNYMKGHVQEAINKGEIKQCDPELTSFIIFKLYISLIFDWEKNHTPLQAEEIALTVERSLLEGLSIR
ncbi:TetR/AcrR family transcriptional regulator [Niallia taxi]|uniref:TetR/AcrR family transcriptional regulator n=1 Tax=Niallia taxi TaxID=2499688 RepID=UPI002E23BEA4|nr:TetR/AcrR family transcriptional regulator [Niallia taxi]